jgi:two-component system chemotaxis response regulator CheB
MPATAPEKTVHRDLVVMGGSVGGVPAMLEIAAGLPADFPAAILAVLHIGPNRSQMPELLSRSGPLPSRHPVDGERPERGVIHIAPPDRHMVLERGRIRLLHGPKEHHTRPAIDPLFRSAAAEFGERAIGMVLSGGMDDGTAGLQAIKSCGGLAVVQHPSSAIEPSMPMSAITYAPVDYVRPLRELPALLVELAGSRAVAQAIPPDRLLHELANFNGARQPMDHLDAIGTRSRFTCPECQGVLWEIDGELPVRYRCHTGHAFSLRSLDGVQRKTTEDAIWAAIRALQERESLLRRQVAAEVTQDQAGERDQWLAEAEAAARHADLLKAMVEGAGT